MRKAAAPRNSGKNQKTTARFFHYMKTIFGEDPLRHTVNSQPTWTEERKEGSLTYMKCVFSRQTICGKERKEGESRGGIEEGERRSGLHLWHRAESISHKFCLWAFITLVRPLKSPIREDLRTRWLWRWSSAFKPDKWLSRWAFTTYVSLSDAMKGPHASDEKKSTILAFLVSGAASALKQNEWPSRNRSRQAEDRPTIRWKAEDIHVRQTWTRIFGIVCYSLHALMQRPVVNVEEEL